MSFLQICIEFFCEAIKAGIPLRGCISTGMATMNQHDSIYFGRPLVEAARGETAQSCIGMAFGRSFNNYHPVYNRYFIPYLGHIKEYGKGVRFLSPMAVDWPRESAGHANGPRLCSAGCRGWDSNPSPLARIPTPLKDMKTDGPLFR